MKLTERIAIPLIFYVTGVGVWVALGSGVFTACSSVGEPKNDKEAQQIVSEADPALIEQYRQRIADLEAAQATPEPEDDTLAEQNLRAVEDELAAARGAQTGRAIGGALGSALPGFGPLGGALGWLAGMEAAKMILTRRGRLLLRQAARALGPDAPGAEGSLALVDALRAILASVGWGHSSEASEAAAEATVGRPKPVRVTVADLVKAASPSPDSFVVTPIGTPKATVERRDVANSIRPQ